MAYKGKLFIAGREELSGIFNSGLVLNISKKSTIDFIYNSTCGNWQVEFKLGVDDVVARSTKKLSKNELLTFGFEQIQRALDILSIKRICSITLVDPARNSIGVYFKNGQLVLFYYVMLDIPMGVSCEIKQLDRQGNEIPLPLVPEPIWSESFRYYRLSQSSNDLFEAYRNLFLGFEALLNKIHPKKKITEGAWFRESLEEIHKKIDLSQHTPSSMGDPVSYIMKSQYQDIRCKLLHAKLPNASLPHSSINPIDVKQAYEQLIRIWLHIANFYLNVPNSSSFVTYLGFEKIMSSTFQDGCKLSYTSDNSIPHKDDSQISPKGSIVYDFDSTVYKGSCRPGVIQIYGHEYVNEEKSKDVIYRVCLSSENEVFSISHIENGLKITGIDEWESITEMRLINSSQPSVEFKT